MWGVYWGLYEEDKGAVDVLMCSSPSASMLAHDFFQILLSAM
jgi:hypothetical protein